MLPAATGRAAHRGVDGERSDIQLQGGAPVRDHDGRLGHRRDAGRRDHRRPAALARPHVRHSVAVVRPAPPAAHQRGDLRVRGLGAVRDLVLRRAAHLPGAVVLRHARSVHVLGLDRGDRARRDHAADGHDVVEGVRGARVADRPPDHGGVGRLCGRVLRHDRPAPHAAHLRRQLVLRCVHPDHRPAAHRQQSRDPGLAHQVVLDLPGRPGRDGPVVVRPQCGRLLPHRGLPRDHVLLRAEAGRAAHLQLPALGRALLGADLHLHVGGAAPPALHGAARSSR